MSDCKLQWNEATLQRRVGQNSRQRWWSRTKKKSSEVTDPKWFGEFLQTVESSGVCSFSTSSICIFGLTSLMLSFLSAKIRWNSWCRNVCVANFDTLSTQVNPEVTNLFEASTSTQPLYIHTFEDLKALKRLQEQPSHREDTSHQNISPLIESNLGERKKRAAGWCQWEQTREAAEVKHRDGFWKANWTLAPLGDHGKMKCS